MPTIPFPPGALVLPYLRDSGGREQDASVDRQRTEIAAWATQHDLIIPRWFFDPARSGRSTAGREHFLQLIDYLTGEARPERGIVIWDYSRLARDFDDTMYYLADLRRRGYIVWSISDAIPDTLEGRVIESMMAWKDAKYRQDLSRNIRSGMHWVVQVHRAYPQRKPPIGYQRAPLELAARRDGRPHTVHRLVPDPAVAPTIRQAFTLRAEGATYAEIHNALHLTAWHTSLNRILRDPIYIGTLQFGGQEYPDFCEPLITRDLWEAAQRTNVARRGRRGYNQPRAARSRFLLTGLLVCDVCGSPMHAHVQQRPARTYDYYRCQAAANGKAATCHASLIPKEQMETLVLDQLELALQPDSVATILSEARRHLAGREKKHREEIARLGRQASETERSIRNVLRAITESGHSRALLDELAAMETRRDEIAAATAALASTAASPVDVDGAPGLEHKLSILMKTLRGNPAQSVTALRGLVVEVRARRLSAGGSFANRSQPIHATITYRLPFSDVESRVSV